MLEERMERDKVDCIGKMSLKINLIHVKINFLNIDNSNPLEIMSINFKTNISISF
jgi:hypothetical protein